jgi:hypothetical protein
VGFHALSPCQDCCRPKSRRSGLRVQPNISRLDFVASCLLFWKSLGRRARYARARMTPISFLRQLYSLDTLDTRFTTLPRTPLKAANTDPAQAIKPQDDKPPATLPPGASPSRWRTPEFYLYALVHLVVVPQMFKAVVDVSQCTYSLIPGLPIRPATENPLTMTQLPIPTTPNSPTFSPLGGYRAAKSYVEALADGTTWADCLDAGQLR